jgi:AsmA protein
LKRVVKILVVFVVVIVATVAIAPFLIPASVVKERALEQVGAVLGWRLRIDGDLSLSFFPNLAFYASDVGLSGEAGADGVEFLTAEQVRFGLAIVPLLSGRIEISRATLVNPVIHLETDKAGRTSWRPRGDLGGPAGVGDAAKSEGAPAPMVSAEEVSISSVRIVSGRLLWRDGRTGLEVSLSDFNLEARMPDIAGELTVDGAAVWNNRKTTFKATINSLAGILAGERVAAKLDLAGPLVKAVFDGRVDPVTAEVDGDLSVESGNAVALAGWLSGAGEKPAPEGDPLTLSTRIEVSADTIGLGDLSTTYRDVHTSGSVEIALKGSRPAVRGKLATGPIVVAQIASDTAAPAAAKKGWSGEKMDFTALALADAELEISAQSISWRNLKIGHTRLNLKLRDGKLSADLPDLALYAGKGAVTVTLDARGVAPVIGLVAALKGVQIYPLLRDAAAFERLEGTSDLMLILRALGASQAYMVNSLAGEAAVDFADGAIRGINIAQMIRGLSSEVLLGWNDNQTLKTDFSQSER